ncbi:hypothetical protein TNCV_2491451 [Trichonephila clavipes]|nr:hypothetical protein TNCV_2491451 [Trichonephila clavipes]
MYSVCTWSVFGGIGHRTQAFRSGVRCSKPPGYPRSNCHPWSRQINIEEDSDDVNELLDSHNQGADN